jgi:hypothetical protein
LFSPDAQKIITFHRVWSYLGSFLRVAISMSYTEIIESLPSELRVPIARLVDALKDELGVTKSDFSELKAIVRDLAEAQKRTEGDLSELKAIVRDLAEAQKRTEGDLNELKAIVRDLADAQNRTEVQVEELANAQKRTEDELVLFRRTFTSQIGGLGARWGLQSEEAFRQGMRSILQEVGFTTERFLEYDAVGNVFGHPEQIELDIIAKNGKVIVVEIKSALDRAHVYIFARKVEFYIQRTGRKADRKLIITPYADNRAKEVGVQLGIEICTDITTLS